MSARPIALAERRGAWLCVAATALVALLWPTNDSVAAAWIAPVLALLPLLPLAIALCLRLSYPLYYAGLGMLFYFNHGVMEAYATPATRVFAAAEIVFTLAYFALLLVIRQRGKASIANESEPGTDVS